MYLRSIKIKNVGPLLEVDLTLPFKGELPKPLVLVGKNGSGKTTVISFIVNALIALKQQVYTDAEVEQGKVYRLRSSMAINGFSEFYFARLDFDRNISMVEWMLSNEKEKIIDQDALQKIDPSWQSIPSNETSHFALSLGDLGESRHFLGLSQPEPPAALVNLLQNTSLLFFPADRFEPPDWLNTENLSSELAMPEPTRIRGKTSRRILSKNRLKPTLDWLHSVIFDMLISERSPENADKRPTILFNAVTSLLNIIVGQGAADLVQLNIGNRISRVIGTSIIKNGEEIKKIKDLTSLSAGESALFCLFASIIRDADLANAQFLTPAEISGIVVIDEVDLHLHIGLQFDALPKLMAMFPKIQFVLTLHAPMVALGLEHIFGEDGFEIREMPTGENVSPESYSEFLTAYDIFLDSKKFQTEVAGKVKAADFPVILVEGKTDAALISTAWAKLFPEAPIPFEIIPCGVEPHADQRNGGAEVLRRCVEYLSIVTDKNVIAVFDNDRAGNEQFNGLNKVAFSIGSDEFHKKHKAKNIHAILLPTPIGREKFTSSPRITNLFLSIEHYFSDILLSSVGFSLEPIVPDSSVFEIDASGSAKVSFAVAAQSFQASEFANFAILFDRLRRGDLGGCSMDFSADAVV